MTEKEFRKLRRRDLLQLLVAQGKENLQLQQEFDETSSALAQAQESNERLKERLNEKDALIEKLKGRLDQKDARIRKLREDMEAWRNSRQIQLEEAGSIAAAALKLSGIFEAAQQAADQYLYNLKMQCGLEKKEPPLELGWEYEEEPEDPVEIQVLSEETDTAGTQSGPEAGAAEEEPDTPGQEAGEAASAPAESSGDGE